MDQFEKCSRKHLALRYLIIAAVVFFSFLGPTTFAPAIMRLHPEPAEIQFYAVGHQVTQELLTQVID
ncbi:MAG: hypothetical protein FWE46_02570 [Coriobacteriia bacterium]|nr:hypothetical protein [Coriobacteriia bacterium]MCL2537228.1 hypothetical protein [Coriobacteriia bacterium]